MSKFGKTLPDGEWIGESWDVADLPAGAASAVADPRSRVASGPFAGRALCELIAEFGEDFLGCAGPTVEGDFPLLVKLLDAREHLSVQVHPDKMYVKQHPGARLKTESWYVIAADPGAHLYLGLRDGVTVADVASRLGTAGVIGLLRTVPAVPGDFHHLPAGLVHALGAGVMVAEVQTPSDTTFRIYDWEDRYSRPHRTMHGAQALEAIRTDLESVYSPRPDRPGTRSLLTKDFYWISEHRSGGGLVDIKKRPEVRVLLMVEGNAAIAGLEVARGDVVVVPAAIVPWADVEASRGAIILEIGLV